MSNHWFMVSNIFFMTGYGRGYVIRVHFRQKGFILPVSGRLCHHSVTDTNVIPFYDLFKLIIPELRTLIKWILLTMIFIQLLFMWQTFCSQICRSLNCRRYIESKIQFFCKPTHLTSKWIKNDWFVKYHTVSHRVVLL